MGAVGEFGHLPPEAVRAVVGHISTEMTQRYYRPAIDTLPRLQRAAEVNLATLTKNEEIPENRRISFGPTRGRPANLRKVQRSKLVGFNVREWRNWQTRKT